MLETIRRVPYRLPKCYAVWSANAEKEDQHFYSPSVNAAFCFFVSLRSVVIEAELASQPNFARW